MHSDLALKMASDLFWTGLLICLPILGFTMLVGLVISVLQVITQVQEGSLTFALGGASAGLYKHLQDLDGNLRAGPDASERAALMADQDHDGSEAATPYKLQKAQKQGQVANAVAAVVFTSAIAHVAWQGWHATTSPLGMLRLVLIQAATADPATTIWPVIKHLLMELLNVVSFSLALMAAAVWPPWLKPARIFSLRTLFDRRRWTHSIQGVRSDPGKFCYST